MVPDGWERKPIKDLCDSIIDCVNKTAKHVDYKTPYKMIRTTNVRNGRVDTSNVRYVDENTYKQWIRRGAPKNGDIIFTREAPVGEAGVLENAKGIFLGQRTMMYRAHPQKSDNRFLFYSLISGYCQKQIEDFSNGGTVAHMRVPDCGEIIINTPPLPEQRKIAKILSTWDKAITTTEKLITTSQQQKKALMQQLLTGKKRLINPETGMVFEGDWEEVKLNTITKVSIGLVTTMTKHYVPDGVPLIRNSDIKPNKVRKEKLIFLSESFASENKHRKFQLNDVVTVHTGEVGVSAVIADDMVGSIGFATLNTRPNLTYVFPQFLSWYFNSDYFINWCVSMSTGDGRQNLNLKDFVKAVIPLPNIKEQQKIASVLTAADKEVALLQAKLAHLKQEKKALMQQLLTGKRRVNVEGIEAA